MRHLQRYVINNGVRTTTTTTTTQAFNSGVAFCLRDPRLNLSGQRGKPCGTRLWCP